MDLVLENRRLSWDKQVFPCVWGHGGVRLDKNEGDGATPVGAFPFRRVFYRPDRISAPKTCLPVQALTPQDGWCDDSHDPCYNQFVTLPYAGRHENLWREDCLYDLILVVGHNDDPIVKGRGSAVFVHLFTPEKKYTEGCVALQIKNLLQVLKEADKKSCLIVNI